MGSMIPSEYLRCDFLQTNGYNARIDTGVAGNNDALEISGDVEVMTFWTYGCIFNTPQSGNSKVWRLLLPSAIVDGNSNPNRFLIFGSYKHYATSVFSGETQDLNWGNLPKRFQFKVNYGYAEVTINGTTYSYSAPNDDNYDPCPSNIILCGAYANSGSTDGYNIFQTRVYHFSIKSQDTLIRDYYPVVRKSDNLAGFYDLVNDTFNPSIGSKPFLPGFKAYAPMQLRRRMIENAMQLPPGYTQCDYLQTVGAVTRFDTGVAGNNDYLKFDFSIMPLGHGNYSGLIMGNHSGEDKKCWRFIQSATASANAFNMTLNNRQAGSSPRVTISEIDSIVDKKFVIHMEYGTGSVLYNGTKYTITAVTTTNDVSTANVYIGANGPTTSTSTTGITHRFYYFRITDGNKVIRDYRPCIRKSDNVAGFYDLVNHTFNPSETSTQFIAGND